VFTQGYLSVTTWSTLQLLSEQQVSEIAVVGIMQKTIVVRKGSIGIVGLFVAMTVCRMPVLGEEDRATLLKRGKVIAQGTNVIFEEDS